MPRTKKSSFSGVFSIFRPIFTILVLSAFVLGISFFVKTISTSSSGQILLKLHPLLAKLHLDDKRLGVVAGEFVSRVSQTGIEKSKSANVDNSAGSSIGQSGSNTQQLVNDAHASSSELSFTVALLADSHGNNVNLSKALQMSKDQGAQTAFFLGDYTDFGEIANLTLAKSTMDGSGLEYFSLPGDHDLADSVGLDNFIKVFGKHYFTKTINGFKFVGLDNSANYTLINSVEMAWFSNELKDADFVLLSQPIYSPDNDVLMGIVDGKVTPNIRAQALQLLDMIEASKARAIIAADQHLSSQNKDPKRSELMHIVIGALTEERNLQSPRFAVMQVYKDGSYIVNDVLLK